MGTLRIMGQIGGLGGLAIGVFLILFRDIISNKQFFGRLTKQQTYKILRLMVILVWIIGVAGIAVWRGIPTPPPDGNGSGLRLHSIHWEHNYKPGGDFVGEIRYKVSNESNVNIVELVPDDAGWFGWDIDYSKYFKVHGNDSSFCNLRSSVFHATERIDTNIDGTERKMTYFNWTPRVKPGLKPQKTLEYSVIISTKGTEKAAFSPEGSFAGMATPHNAGKLSCRINAPSGYMLLMKGFIVKDKTGLGITSEAEISGPRLSSDGSHITWEVDDPVFGADYLVSIVIKEK